MIERFYSGEYNENFSAVCDEIYLPFWGINEWYESKKAYPFVAYIDEYGKISVAVGKKGWTHNDIFSDILDLSVNRSKSLCGRFWNLSTKKILTIWDDSPSFFLQSSTFSQIVDSLSEEGLSVYNANLIFEAYEDGELKAWTYGPSEVGFYIYSIPVKDYVSKKMSSFSDVVKEYDIQERKKASLAGAPAGRWKNWDYKNQGVGYLGYHLMTRQDENKNMLNEGILYDKLPEDIKLSIINNETSLGNNPAIPDIYDMPFLLKIANKRFEDIKNTLVEIGEINDFEDTDINSMLAKLINKCIEIERPFRDKLEKLCVNYVIDTFNVPEDSVQINLSLSDSIDLNAPSIIVDPVDGDEDLEFDSVDSASMIRAEVYKRRILESLCMGGAISLSSNIDSYKDSIQEISPELCELYHKIIALNNYAIYMKDDIGIDDKNKKQLGTVNVEFGSGEQQVRITAQGKIFPVLLSETLRGFIELFISHGLPKEKKLAEIIIGKSDFLKAEPWDMRIGPSLWVLFSNSLNDVTLDELPYLLKRIATLDVDKFNFLMKEVFAKTKKGKQIMSKICNKAKNDIEYSKFTDKMSKMKLDKSIITDEFIKEEEL